MSVRVLYSFPHKIGAGRICSTAWHQVAGVAEAGGDVTLFAGVVERPLGPRVRTSTTLARGRWRVPYSAIGHMRALSLHDRIVARQLPKLAHEIDVVHVWPLAASETIKAAKRLGIPTVLERPNAHTRFAMQVVADEGRRLGVELPAGHEHAYNESKLRKEESEYQLADWLLCPSEFVVTTFREQGVPQAKLLRHIYGYDDRVFYPRPAGDESPGGLQALFVGVCAIRKGVHFALEAWLRSAACVEGTFRIAGEFLAAYERRLSPLLAHPSVEVLGHRDDVADLMRESDVLLLPSIEEGFGLTCVEAIGSGCVPLVSNACTDVCVHERNALVHPVADVDALTRHLDAVTANPDYLTKLRDGCLDSAPNVTWSAAGRRLLDVYEEVVDRARRGDNRSESRPLVPLAR